MLIELKGWHDLDENSPIEAILGLDSELIVGFEVTERFYIHKDAEDVDNEICLLSIYCVGSSALHLQYKTLEEAQYAYDIIKHAKQTDYSSKYPRKVVPNWAPRPVVCEKELLK